jgi:putative transposase
MSERGSCDAVGISRSTLRYEASVKPDEEIIRARIRELAHYHRRYGYRRIQAVLEREGCMVNIKRVHRIWKDEGLQIKRKRPKRRSQCARSDVINRAAHPNHVWSYDFVHDSTRRGGMIKLLTVLDEYTRESLLIRVESRLDSVDVVETLSMLFKSRGVPKYIRSDNGSEFIANRLKKWFEEQKCSTIYIEPGSPWENPYIESFNGKLRDECLNMNEFENIKQAREIISEWRCEYNEARPHSSLNYLTPEEFASRYWIPPRATPSEVSNTAFPIYPKL